MDLPAFALHTDRFGVNFIARSRFCVHAIGLLHLGAGALLAKIKLR